MPRHTFVVSAEARIDLQIATHVASLSRSAATRLVKNGHVRCDGAVVARASLPVSPPSVIEVEVPAPREATVEAQDLPIEIVHEDADLAVINKASGMVVHPAPGHPDGTLVNALLHHLDGLSGVGGELRPGIVHRLDRGTSGLMVVAKHDAAHRALAAQFADHSAGRRYLALCLGRPKEERGTIESHLGRHPRDRLRMASVPPTQGRRAVTHWRVRARAGTVTLIECRLETGRTHQVRVHLAEKGWRILGDGLYGSKDFNRIPARIRRVVDTNGGRPLLHAWRLDFKHPQDQEARSFRVPPPADYARVLTALELPADPTQAAP
ncbi:MAG: RluA family pseudouridine synthase [Myxococcota bacterium]